MNKRTGMSAVSFLALVIGIIVIIVCVILITKSSIEAGAVEENKFKSDLESFDYDLGIYLARFSTSRPGADFNKDGFYADANSITYNGDKVDGTIYDILTRLKKSSAKKYIKISKGKIDITSITEEDKCKWAKEVLGNNLVSLETIKAEEEEKKKEEEAKIDRRNLGEGTSDKLLAKEKKIPYVPLYFNYLEGTTIDNGYIIFDSKGNEYVWIPVNDFYDYSGYDDKKTKIFESIKNYGGFYVARYEASIEGTKAVSKPNRKPKNNICFSLGSESAINFASNVASNNEYNDFSSYLLYKEQWEEISKFVGKESEKNSSKWGNYLNTSFEIKNLKALASEDDGKVYTVQNSKLTNRASLYTTGAYSLNCIKEIYDLAGNLGEFVIDSENDLVAVAGGDYKSFTGSQSINTLNYVEKNKAYANVGFRFSLYVIEQ